MISWRRVTIITLAGIFAATLIIYIAGVEHRLNQIRPAPPAIPAGPPPTIPPLRA